MWYCTIFVLFIGSCSYVNAFTLDFRWVFEQLRIQSRSKQRKAKTKNAHCLNIESILIEAIQLHYDIIEFVPIILIFIIYFH